MGISANQARLLALTARKCDLETQMQVILNNKVNIAKETSSIADDYSKAVSNRRLFIFKPSLDITTSAYQDLSAKNLYNAGGLLLVRKTGANSYAQVDTKNSDAIEKGLREGTIFLVKDADLKTQDPKTINFSIAGYGGAGANILTTDLPHKQCEIIDWRTSTTIMDELDKSDDTSAQLNYETMMKHLESKEASLDLEMNSIQTSHSAITNEIESVKKVLTKNTEDTFKYFT